MKTTSILALVAAAVIVATSGVVIAASTQSGFNGWFGHGGMMGGWGMMGGGSQYGDRDDYRCPMYDDQYWEYNGTTGMPCWGANQTWHASYPDSYCWINTVPSDTTTTTLQPAYPHCH